MTANPVDDGNPDDPVQILRALPVPYHEQFLAEYEAAVDGARVAGVMARWEAARPRGGAWATDLLALAVFA